MNVTYRTKQGETLDLICQRYYGYQAEAVEAVLAANPGLADRGPKLPAGVTIILPELTEPAADNAQPIRLWD